MGRVWCRGSAIHLEADFTDAERLLMLADRHTRGVTHAQEWTLSLTAAQVHATLALAAAIAVGTAGPNVHAWADVAATTKPEAPGPSPLTESGLGMGCNPCTGVLVRHCTSPLKLACASYLTGEADIQS